MHEQKKIKIECNIFLKNLIFGKKIKIELNFK